jgi:peptidoglycan/xylan/chitin deacetylase (PgdA/CDA1 family)
MQISFINSLLAIVIIGFFQDRCFGQSNPYSNARIINELRKDSVYKLKREGVLREFAGANAGAWGEFVKGVDVRVDTHEKLIALTFDACGGPKSSGYDSLLISFLKDQNVHATLFVTGKWIDSNYSTFLKLSKDTLFEIENHGLNHKPCSFKGESVYCIKGTSDPKSAYDEVEVNAIKILHITGRKPLIYRSATAYIDEVCVQMAGKMGYTVISYDVLSADAMPSLPAEEIKQTVLKHIHPGAIIIMHFNHPEWNTRKALEKIIPELRKQGYSFVLLRNQHLLQAKTKIKH